MAEFTIAEEPVPGDDVHWCVAPYDAELGLRTIRAGTATARLDSNGSLTEVLGLDRNHGYCEVEPFPDERYAVHWYEKDLAPDEQP